MLRQRVPFGADEDERPLDEQQQEALILQLEEADTTSSSVIHAGLSGLLLLLALYLVIAPLPLPRRTSGVILRLVLVVDLVMAAMFTVLGYVDLKAPRRYTIRHRDFPLRPLMRLVERKDTLYIALAISFLAPVCLQPSSFFHVDKLILMTPMAAIGLTLYASQQIDAVRAELTKLRGAKYPLQGA